MKVIKLTESQLKMLIESEIPDFGSGDVKEYGDSSEIGTTVTTRNTDDEPEYGKPMTTDDYSGSITPQNLFARKQYRG